MPEWAQLCVIAWAALATFLLLLQALRVARMDTERFQVHGSLVRIELALRESPQRLGEVVSTELERIHAARLGELADG